MLFIVVQFAAS